MAKPVAYLDDEGKLLCVDQCADVDRARIAGLTPVTLHQCIPGDCCDECGTPVVVLNTQVNRAVRANPAVKVLVNV